MTPRRKENTVSKSSRNRIAFAASLACGLFVALAVGALAGQTGSTSPVSPTPTTKGEPATEAMAAFNGLQRDGDRQVTEGAQRALEELTRDEVGVSAALLPGAALKSHARTLVTGGSGLRLVGAPTSKGRVCAVLMSRSDVLVSGGCVEAFTDTLPVSHLVTTLAGEPAIVTGLVADDVKSVAIVANGVENQARLRNNAFVFQLASAGVAPTAIRASLVNGSTVAIDI
jgi:hypothetical protein